ncbi:MAG: mechanosensitive ion channel [Desulfobacterales bacterium]|nr:mechanosensitive ion channel [Desulfobacterales bacterium]
MMNKSLIIYLCVMGATGVLLYLWSSRRINIVEAQRRLRIKGLKHFDSARTQTPLDAPVEDARETALESVEARFSIIRKVTQLSLVLIWVVALVFPLLNNVPAAMVSVLVAAAGIIVGVASRPFIENLIAGMVMSFAHPIRLGDTVIIDGQYGTVEDLSITYTIIKIWNWRRYVIPNSRMLAKEFVNCTINDSYQWKHVQFWVAYDTDLEKVQALAVEAAKQSRYFADYEPPRFWVMEMEKEGIQCWIAAWANSPSNAWQLGHDIRTRLVLDFAAHGITTHRFQFERPGGPALGPTSADAQY